MMQRFFWSGFVTFEEISRFRNNTSSLKKTIVEFRNNLDTS